MLTDRPMLDVLRSTTTVFGELCVMTALTTETLELPASCSDLGEFHMYSIIFCLKTMTFEVSTHILFLTFYSHLGPDDPE